MISISEDLWAVEEMPGKKIKVFEKVNGQWDVLHPKHIHATCRSAIAKAGYGNHTIWNWQIEKAKELRAKGLSNLRISLALMSPKACIDQLIGPWQATEEYINNSRRNLFNNGSFLDKEHLVWMLKYRIKNWSYDQENDPTGKIRQGREIALPAASKMTEAEVLECFHYTNFPKVNLSGAIEIWMESLIWEREKAAQT